MALILIHGDEEDEHDDGVNDSIDISIYTIYGEPIPKITLMTMTVMTMMTMLIVKMMTAKGSI